VRGQFLTINIRKIKMSNLVYLPQKPKTAPKTLNIKKRLPFLYIEGGNISIKDGCMLVELKEEKETVPLNMYNLIIFSDRCRITTAAIQIITDKGCAVSIESKNKLPSVSFTRKYRSCSKKYKQFQMHINKKERTRVAKKLLEARNEIFKEMGLDIRIKTGFEMEIPTLMANEGNAMKAFYKTMNFKHKADYNITTNRPIYTSLSYYLLYSFISAVLYGVNLDQNLGFLHGKTKGGGFIFDLADVFKPLIYEHCIRLEKDPNFKGYLIYKEMEGLFEKHRFSKKIILLLKDLNFL
jgi:CRISPR-associated endonuclease Cas1